MKLAKIGRMLDSLISLPESVRDKLFYDEDEGFVAGRDYIGNSTPLPYDRPITSIPPGEQSFEVKVNVKPEGIRKLNEMFLKLIMTRADEFRLRLKNDHRIPPLDADTYKALGAENIVLSKQPSGNYKIVAVDFEDGTSWENNAY